jgi:teichuronic acid exporter
LKNLNKKIASGVFWNAIQLLVNRSFSFVIKLFLARILLPEEFGLVGMAIVFTSFIEVLNDLGMGAAIIQRKQENLSEEHFQTAFWSGVAWSFFIYLVMVFGVAPFAVNFYKESMLGQIIPVLSLGILSSPINMVHKAQLTKALDFKKLTYINNFSNIFSGVLSLALAFLGFGIWSLVFNSIASFLIAMPLYFRATGWKPKFMWSEQAFKDIFGFGIFTTGTNLFNNLMNKLDYLLIGKLMTAADLGAYTLAFVLTDTFRSQVMGVMNKVMFPVYSSLQGNSKELKMYYSRVVKYNCLLVFPVMLFFIGEGEAIIILFFGQKWNDAILPLQILSGSVLFHMMVNSNTVVVRGMGKAKLEMQLQIYKSIFLYIPVLVGMIYFYGIIGAALAFLIIKFVSVFIVLFYLNKLIGYTFTDMFLSVKPVLLASSVPFFTIIAIHKFLPLNFYISSFLFFSSYILSVYFIMGKEVKEVVRKIKKKPLQTNV